MAVRFDASAGLGNQSRYNMYVCMYVCMGKVTVVSLGAYVEVGGSFSFLHS